MNPKPPPGIYNITWSHLSLSLYALCIPLSDLSPRSPYSPPWTTTEPTRSNTPSPSQSTPLPVATTGIAPARSHPIVPTAPPRTPFTLLSTQIPPKCPPFPPRPLRSFRTLWASSPGSPRRSPSEGALSTQLALFLTMVGHRFTPPTILMPTSRQMIPRTLLHSAKSIVVLRLLGPLRVPPNQ